MILQDIGSISKRARALADKQLSDFGLSYTEQITVMQIATNSGCNQETLATNLAMDKGSVARIVARLEKKGFVTRTPNPASKRENLLELTPKALALISKLQEGFDQISEALFAGLTQQEIEQTSLVLQKISANLADISGEL